jgi:hypothetical protein
MSDTTPKQASSSSKKSAQDMALGNEKMNSSHRNWNDKGGWLKKPGEPNVFDITLDDIVATKEPLHITTIMGREPDAQYPAGCSVLFLRDLLRRFSIPYKSLSKSQCLQRLAAFKFNLPMPEFDDVESSEKPASSQKKKRASVEKSDKVPSKRVKKASANTASGDAPPLETLLEALTAIKNVGSQDGEEGLQMIRSLTEYYTDKRVMDLQSYYWQCLQQVKETCTAHDVNWESWRDKANYESSAVHPDCIEARKQLQDTQARLEQARGGLHEVASVAVGKTVQI